MTPVVAIARAGPPLSDIQSTEYTGQKYRVLLRNKNVKERTVVIIILRNPATGRQD